MKVKEINEQYKQLLYQFCEDNDKYLGNVISTLGSMLLNIRPTKQGLKYVNNRDWNSYYGIGAADRKSVGIEINVDDDYVGDDEVSTDNRIPKLYIRYVYGNDKTLRYDIDTNIDPEQYGFRVVDAGRGVCCYGIKLDIKKPTTQIRGLRTFFKDFLQAVDKCVTESSNESLSYLDKYSPSNIGNLILKMGQKLYCTNRNYNAFFDAYSRCRRLGIDTDYAFVPTFESKTSYITSVRFEADNNYVYFLFKNDRDAQNAINLFYKDATKQRKSGISVDTYHIKVYADAAIIKKWLNNEDRLYFIQFDDNDNPYMVTNHRDSFEAVTSRFKYNWAWDRQVLDDPKRITRYL